VVVAGLTNALAAAGMFPAASCRGHKGTVRPWSEFPVVLVAADELRAHALQPLMTASGGQASA
jgi:hypothetical protein